MIRERTIQREGQTRVSISLATGLVQQADKRAARMGLSRTAIVNLALRNYLGVLDEGAHDRKDDA